MLLIATVFGISHHLVTVLDFFASSNLEWHSQVAMRGQVSSHKKCERETTLTTPRRVRILHTFNFTRTNWTHAASETSPELPLEGVEGIVEPLKGDEQ